MANNNVSLIDLDFYSIKNSLKNYLRDNEQFRDYDFEGSNINLLLELLAINGYRTAFYQNMVLNESFLDSALLRNSVLSRSKELNYLPRSAKSSRARVSVSFEADGSSAPYNILKSQELTALVKNDSFTFSIPDNLVVASTNNVYQFETDIFEGVFLSDSYTFGSEADDIFKISNRNVDTDSITVTVYEDGNEVGDTYIYASSLLDLTTKSKVFFLQASPNSYYEVLFGDDNIGRKPKLNSTIVINYRISNGSVPNGAREFTLNFDPTGNDELTSAITVTTLQSSIDGIEEESIGSIKYAAPRHFQVQERGVIASDYKSILRNAFPEIRAVHAYGGEDLTPPIYGRVYISVDIKDVDGLPESKKTAYTNFMKKRTTFGIVPFFQSPEFTYILADCKVRYNVNITSSSQETLKTVINKTIINYRDDNLGDFDTILRQSKLECDIDAADRSIISSDIHICAYKKLDPSLGSTADYSLSFGVPLRSDLLNGLDDRHPNRLIHSMFSSTFYYNSEAAVIEDDGLGALWVMRAAGEVHEKIINIGTVDYVTGQIEIKNLKVDSYLEDALRIYVRPEDQDLAAQYNNILTIEPAGIKIDMQEVRI